MPSCGNSIGGSRSTGRKRKLISPSVMMIRNTIVVAIGRLTETDARAIALRSVQRFDDCSARQRFLTPADQIEQIASLHLLQTDDVIPRGRLDQRLSRVVALEEVVAQRDDPVAGLDAAHRRRQPAAGDDL